MHRSSIGEPRFKNAPTPEEIRQRAYEIHIERGGRLGNELDDWLRAERELERIALYIRSWNRLSILDGRQLLNFEDCDDGKFESQGEILADSGRESLDQASHIQRSPNLER
jgi:DUF2934 family protein